MKSQHPGDVAITDESIAAAYIQNFGLEVFERADKQMRNNTVNAQTADTLQAAVTFLDLLQIWQPVPAEVIAKVRYAKFHALRIVRATKSGEDPNATNPVQEPEPNADGVTLDPNDPEVQNINNAAAYQPSVEDAYDDGGLGSPPAVPTGPPRRTSSIPRPLSTGAVSPIVRLSPGMQVGPVAPGLQPSQPPSPVDSNPRQDSIGGGYFPTTVSPPPGAPNFQPPPSSVSPPRLPSAPPAPDPSEAASRAYYQGGTPSAPSFPSQPSPQRYAPPGVHNALAHAHVARGGTTSTPTNSSQPTRHLYPSYAAPGVPNALSSPLPPANGSYIDDDLAVANAQKHARWAISALNFEDVPTAVKELREALRVLGAG